MTAFLDTSVIVRYLTAEPPELAERLAAIIESESILWITDVVLVETAYVLTSCYEVPRAAVVDHLIEFIRRENIRLHHLKEDSCSKPC